MVQRGKEFVTKLLSADVQGRMATRPAREAGTFDAPLLTPIDASPRSLAEGLKLQAAFGSSALAQVQAPVQRFQNIVLAGRQIRLFGPPVGAVYTFINGSLKQLQALLNDFSNFEDESLEMVRYWPEAQQRVLLISAVQKLDAIHARATQTQQYIAGDQAYAPIAADLVDVLSTALQDRAERDQQRQDADNELLGASHQAWGLWNGLQPPTSAELAAAFDRARGAGIVTVVPGFWWSSHNFPGPNAEMQVLINGFLWALVHVKWHNQNPITFENVDMANFKPPDGSTIPNSVIPGSAARTHLIGQALSYAGSAPLPRSPDKAMG